MMKLISACGLLSLATAQVDTGTTGCPCLASPPISSFVIPAGEAGEGLLRARPNGTFVIPYPVSYGTNCGAHDVATEPYCADASGTALPGAADWCTSAWCWVDPADCDIDSDPSSYFHVDGQDAVLHYSYGTCGANNTFADSELDAQACNQEHSDVVASHCSGGVQADNRCPCINWADSPETRAQFENDDGTALLVPLGDPAVNYTYNLGYGSGSCAAHDVNHAPYCADASGAPRADAPDWCQANWCWVDPNNCQLADANGTAIPAVASSYFHRDGQPASRYYSYETCQHDNTFSDTELDPQACNDEHSSVVADHCQVTATQDALTTCPCIATPDPHPFAIANSDPPQVTVTIAGAGVPYPAGYGMNACAPHDELLPPSCANDDGSVKTDAPSWCSSNWCFVDPANCAGVDAPVESSYFHVDGQDATFYYSYATCSHENTFTDSEDDDQACNADHSDTADWCTPPANSVAAQLTLDMDMPDAAGLPAFRTSFKSDVAAAMSIAADKVIITGVAAGSVVVDFYIAPNDDGTALVAADAVSTALAASGVTVAGATPTVTVAPAVTTAPAPTPAPDPDPDPDPDPAPAAVQAAPAPPSSGAEATTLVATVTAVVLAALQ
jgi:hypothetical protein